MRAARLVVIVVLATATLVAQSAHDRAQRSVVDFASRGCDLLGRNAIAFDLDLAARMTFPRGLIARKASERLLFSMSQCPAAFVPVVAEAFTKANRGEAPGLDLFAQVWLDDLDRGFDPRHLTPGLSEQVALVLSLKPPPNNTVWPVFTDQLRKLSVKPIRAARNCRRYLEYEMEYIARDYDGANGDYGAGLVTFTAFVLTQCPDSAISAMRRNRKLLTNMVDGTHDSLFWGVVEGLEDMKALKSELVRVVTAHKPSSANADVHAELLRQLVNACISLIDHKELEPPCPLDDRRAYEPFEPTQRIPSPASVLP